MEPGKAGWTANPVRTMREMGPFSPVQLPSIILEINLSIRFRKKRTTDLP
jgi:hypothetical protein